MGFHGKHGFLQQASQTDEATLSSSAGIWQDANCLKAKSWSSPGTRFESFDRMPGSATFSGGEFLAQSRSGATSPK